MNKQEEVGEHFHEPLYRKKKKKVILTSLARIVKDLGQCMEVMTFILRLCKQNA